MANSIYRVGRGTAELVQTFLLPPPPSEMHPALAFATNVPPLLQYAPKKTAQDDL
jgi:hypothetical protein